MYQESVMVPMGDWAKARLRNLSETDKRRDESKVRSGFGKKFLTGSDGIKPIRAMFCIWQLNALIEIIALFP